MKYYVSFAGTTAPFQEFRTLTEARKFLNDCKREDKANTHHKLKDELQNCKNSYRLVFGCNLYSAASIHTL